MPAWIAPQNDPCAPFRAAFARYRAPPYRRTVTLMLPTLLLLSKARSEIVCSPLPARATFKEYRSCGLSAIPSSGKTSCHGPPSTLTSARLMRPVASVDGGPWHEVFPDEGIADSPHERYSLNVALAGSGEHTISLRAFDNSNNVGSISVTVRR